MTGDLERLLLEQNIRTAQMMGRAVALRDHGTGAHSILLKPGQLTDEEFAVMCRHPVLGAPLLQDLPWFADALPVVRHHHERVDGAGYADSLSAVPCLWWSRNVRAGATRR